LPLTSATRTISRLSFVLDLDGKGLGGWAQRIPGIPGTEYLTSVLRPRMPRLGGNRRPATSGRGGSLLLIRRRLPAHMRTLGQALSLSASGARDPLAPDPRGRLWGGRSVGAAAGRSAARVDEAKLRQRPMGAADGAPFRLGRAAAQVGRRVAFRRCLRASGRRAHPRRPTLAHLGEVGQPIGSPQTAVSERLL
jgi:hypothetical protein